MPRDFNVLVTADEAWPAFERAVLSAEKEIVAGFRIFDLCTRLRSPEALAIGDDWFDLLAHVVRKGVKFDLTVSDFDPVLATPLHEQAWRTVRQGVALTEVARCPMGQVKIRAAMHPAKAGFLPWVALLPAVLPRKWEKIKSIKGIRRKRQAVGLEDGSLPELRTVSHHQKLAVIDGETLYIGGLDLNERRFDTRTHELPASETWSDVQVILKGPAAEDARRHLLGFEKQCRGEAEPEPLPRIRRTLSCPRRFQLPFLSPRTLLREIEEAHIDAFQSARHLIYAETQFLRSGPISDALGRAGRKNKNLTAIMVLPALPEDVAFENNEGLDARYGMALQKQATERLVDAFGDRITFASPVRPVLAAREDRSVLAGSPVIHVHNKVLVRDSDYGIIGSANLNGRSMRWDTEVAIETSHPEQVGHLRNKLFGHWWWTPLPAEAREPETMQAWWREEIRKNGVRRPTNRTGFLVPYDMHKEEELVQSLPGMTENVV